MIAYAGELVQSVRYTSGLRTVDKTGQSLQLQVQPEVLASITALDANTAWVCNAGAVYKTTDGGLTWDKQETAFQGFNGHPNVIHFFDSNNGVCVGNPNNGYWAIYTTTDGGTNWIRVPSANIPAPIPAGEVGPS